MSFFRGRGAGFRRGHREKDEINRAVSIGRHRGSTTYQFTEKQSRSLSELSSLTDVSLSDLTDVKVDLNSSLLKRLFREYVEVRKYKLRNVSIEPLMNNFTEWHGNIVGPSGTLYEGGIFHFVIEFKDDHPRSPPQVKMLTRIEHPCVLNGQIQLDMLSILDIKRKNFHPPSTAMSKYRYWFPGYTTLSILIQLEALLYEGTVEIALRNLTDLTEYETRKSKWMSGVLFSVEQSNHMSCSSCKHRPRKPWPPTQSDYKPVAISGSDFLYLEHAVCFFSLKTFEEAALGIGINFTKDARSGAVQTVKCVPQVISLSAFKGSKIKEVWGQLFTHWMPIYLAQYSPDRAIYLAERSISTIYTGSPTEFKPEMALDFFPRLLTNCTVSFFQADDGSESLQYLRAYCYMHCLFLQLLTRHSSLIETAREQLMEFINTPAARHINNFPNSGILLLYTTFTGTSWGQLIDAFVYENFDRNVKNVIKKFPELDTSEANASVDATRVSKSFSAYNIIGLRFVMMQLAFNRLFLAPEGSSLTTVIETYNKHHSLLPRVIEDQLLSQIEPILSVNSFSEYFQQIGWHIPNDDEMASLLRKAVSNSRQKHYHGGKGIDVLSPEEFEKQRLGSIRPLEELLAEGEDTDEEQWRTLSETRFGLTEVPESYSSVTQPWKHLYLQHNLQELVGKLNDNPDFKLLYQTLSQSQDVLTQFELVTFNPDNIKSQYYFLSRIIEMLPNLSHLKISKGERGLGEKGFKELVKGLTKSSGSLQVLDMQYLGIEENHVSKLAESHLTSEQLKTLILEGNHLGANGTIKLSQLMIKHRSLPNLSELNLRSCKIADAGMEALAEALLVKRNIRKLDLSKNDASEVGLAKVIKSLAYNPCIEEVNLSELGSVGRNREDLSSALAKLFQLTISLKRINFWKTNISPYITEENMKHLAENTTLTVWDMGSSTGGVRDVIGLVLGSKKSKLEELDLGNNLVNVTKCRRIYEKTEKRVSGVTKLNLEGNCGFLNILDKKDYELMIKFISTTFGHVTHLNISKCYLVSNAAEVIGDVLSRNTSLTHLDMSMNNIGKHGARFIATGLSKNSNLKVLRLDKNNLRSAGAHFLASVLAKPTCLLEELHLFCNFVDVPGGIAICKALQTNTHLKFIDLGLNKIRKRGAAAVIEMLTVNKVLTSIGLKFNYIPDSWAIKIIKQIVEVPKCQIVDVRLAGNSLQYDTLVTIVGLIQESRRSIKFDLFSRAQYLDPDRMERTVYVSPIAANVTPEMLKKLFYSKKCGAITAVTIEKHRKKKAAFGKAKYAFVEFAHKDSVELAIDLMKRREAHLGAGLQPRITRAGLGGK